MKQWHPILTAREPEPGVWWLVDDDTRPYAIVDVVRRHGEVGYRVTTWAETLERRTLIGYWRKLMPAMTAAHEHRRGTGVGVIDDKETRSSRIPDRSNPRD